MTEQAVIVEWAPPDPDVPSAAPPLPESFAACYGRLFRPMARLARVLVDTDEQATDVVQEAFSRLYPRFDRVMHPDAYLRAAVLNEARRVSRRAGLARRKERPEPPAEASPHDHVVDAVRRLPARQAHAVVLRYYLQMTDDEIASTLGLRVGTVKSTLHRAREQLRKELQP